jgi:hypothetical protein
VAVLALCFVATSTAWAQWSKTPPRDGACFYVDFNFRGDYFCMNAGQNAPSVPSGFNDRIRSVRVFGRTRVQFFNDSNFRGINGSTSRDINDLRKWPLPDNPSKNWAVRISSVQLDGGRGLGGGDRDDRDGGGRWYGDRDRDHGDDRDRDHDRDGDRDRDRGDDRGHGNSTTVSCSSDVRKDKQWCRTPGRVNSVRLVNQNGRSGCEYNQSFGIDDGRLWTGRGCSGTFEIR